MEKKVCEIEDSSSSLSDLEKNVDKVNVSDPPTIAATTQASPAMASLSIMTTPTDQTIERNRALVLHADNTSVRPN